MFEFSPHSKQLASSLFLERLITDPTFSQFHFINDRIVSKIAHDNFTPSKLSLTGFNLETEHSSLVIFAEGLSLAKVFAVSMAFSDKLNVLCYEVLRNVPLTGVGIVLRVERRSKEDLRPLLENIANKHAVEMCLFARAPRLDEPGLLLMDMDSTVISIECIDEIAKLAGVGDEVSSVTEQAMQGKLDFAESLRSRVGCLAGANEDILQQVRRALPLMPGIFNLVKFLKQHQWKLAIASGGFSYFADYLADRLELDAAIANGLGIVDGKLTGKVEGDIVDAQVKAATLLELANEFDIADSQTIAMGDGANDLVMMNAAALGVAFHAKPVVRAQADISIRNGGLDKLLWVLAASTPNANIAK
ncbi:phosphoserine phosphatase SerB [Paraglaciecola sp. L1A13]|uniref:phosphoserine phosphatase SerB n=1 Tax=Paraglaciecola sp. L1A13 TaxID=2686359 RepID=UPI00131D3C8F|nr:phosphoserine phosphatase SerB [Paraglaciecola sp. L1A13]